MRKIAQEEAAQLLDDELASKLSDGIPSEVEIAVKEFLDGFSRDYRANIARRTHTDQ